MTVFVFGFEPFLEFDENPTDLIVKNLDGKDIGGHQVVSRTVRVDYSTVEDELVSGIEAARPSIVLGFGLAAGRDRVTPEKVAINYISSKMKDNAGMAREGSQVAVGQPDAFFSDLPVEALVGHLNANSIPASLSLSAGGYLCNYAMYTVLREGRRLGFRSGFVHVPCHAEWVARTGRQQPSLPLETLIRAGELSVAYYVRTASPGVGGDPLVVSKAERK